MSDVKYLIPMPPRTRRNPRRRTEKSASYLPRPALGRRPWFAFLRRARMRRRFALAMGRERTSAWVGRQPMTVRLVAPGWLSPPLRLAGTRSERRRGLAPCPGPFGILMKTRSIHGFRLQSAIEFVALDMFGVVTRSGILRPGGVAYCRGASWIAELPAGSPRPSVDSVVSADRLVAWPAP